jgi:stage V sporulation protein R
MECEAHGAAAVGRARRLPRADAPRRRSYPAALTLKAEAARLAGGAHRERQFNDLWRTLPGGASKPATNATKLFPEEPQENILYFVEKFSPALEPWSASAWIVRKLAQYFHPQGQTKVMNEGWATFWHYTILNRLHERGQVDDGFMLEFLKSHTNVIYQPAFDSRGYGGINPYALGFAMFSDLRRICERPTPEDSAWFPGLAGSDWHGALDFAMRNFKDESFIAQYLSPRLMREFHLFAIADHAGEHALAVDSIHDERGYRRVRSCWRSNMRRSSVPDVQVVVAAVIDH